jgi:hypothetical protein
MCSAHRVETTLEVRMVESYQDFMRRHFTPGMRAFALIFALAFALAGQGLASATMPSEPGGDSLSSITATHLGMCRGCEGMDHSKGMPSNCTIGVCSSVAVLLPAPVPVSALPLKSYGGVAQDKVGGISISPPLGPPRTLHFA